MDCLKSFVMLACIMVVSVAITSQGESTDAAPFPEKIDHIVYAVPDLSNGIDAIEKLLGVRPAYGGSHKNQGTHNALVALGPTTYLEIIAIDPESVRPTYGYPFGLGNIERPRLSTWALRVDAIEKVIARSTAEGLKLGSVISLNREKPDGRMLTWKLTNPFKVILDGAVPFLISWGAAPHPASSAPFAGELLSLHIGHPEPEQVRKALSILDSSVKVEKTDAFRLIAVIRAASEVVELQ